MTGVFVIWLVLNPPDWRIVENVSKESGGGGGGGGPISLGMLSSAVGRHSGKANLGTIGGRVVWCSSGL